MALMYILLYELVHVLLKTILSYMLLYICREGAKQMQMAVIQHRHQAVLRVTPPWCFEIHHTLVIPPPIICIFEAVSAGGATSLRQKKTWASQPA